MNVLHVLAPGETGGLERVVLTLTAGLVARGHAMQVAAILDRPFEHPLFAPLRSAGVTVHQVPVPPRSYRMERRAIAALCRTLAPDVVHSHGYRADVVDAPVARGLGIPTVSTVHGFTRGGWKNRAYELVQRLCLKRFHAVIAVARPQAAELARFGVSPGRLRVIPNAWCPSESSLDSEQARVALGVARDRFHLGWVGRLSWEKGADVFLEAVARLKDLPIEVSMIGDGVERRALEVRARRLGIQSLVGWRGTLSDASKYYPGFDTFVISSRTEGTPIVLFEAMQAGVPIVSTAVGGVPDVVSSDQAYLVPPRDPDALAAAIRDVYQSPRAAAERAARARERLGQFDAATWLECHLVLYEGLRRPGLMAAGTAGSRHGQKPSWGGEVHGDMMPGK